ncbi:hypothetical protein SERPOUNCE_25 [Bacillus phage SerPounce]|uniref:Uncharacterized protein n=2 Tax=Claudivirus TaxID=2842609 RepID=A0A1X9SHN4_9CAUD|nr:hypothetical protein H3011_gp25 [Bacillus phage SerPounce]ARQ95560.1 hypothetical protein SERPOUNCE_25 [Bacillus phage SerPounce]
MSLYPFLLYIIDELSGGLKMSYKGLDKLQPDLEILVSMLMKNCGFTREQSIECLLVSIEAILTRR